MTTIFTIGHSTRSIDDFIQILKSKSISTLIDVRTIPKSRHNPQFGQDEIKKSLKSFDINYVHLKELGGLRPKSSDSKNDGWRNQSFRNYADYMQTNEFQKGLSELIHISKEATTAIMCAEAVPWRCHRSLISDALLIRGIESCEIISEKNVRRHTLTKFAVVKGHSILYPKSTMSEQE